ncbi:MAG: hypothetical protein ACXIUP_00190 [Microcella sp.]
MVSTLFPAGTPASDAVSSTQPVVITLPDGSVVATTTLDEALAELIDGYVDTAAGDDAAAFTARREFAEQFAARRRDMFAAAVAGVLPEEALLGGEPISANQVPQVLVTTDFAPHTDAQAPDGFVEWVNPTTEVSLLLSLHKVGEITVAIAA